ncbi:MOSC domain-containing protein [Undibacterium sp. Rencai35W]|uniref:MOSC domain-containing protein n=1 Tax=Undibacterium sp. Rencai35W TaxID=3413046 RepID=UPI003BF35D98
MPTITELTLYPIKSCAGINLRSAKISESGLSLQTGASLIHDREWMMVDLAGLFLSQRSHPRMALIRPTMEDDQLMLLAPDMPALSIALSPTESAPATSLQVQVWDDQVAAFDCGDQAAAWLSQFLGTACRLVRFNPAGRRLASQKWTGDQEVGTLFSDGFPLLLTSTASLDDLNQKLVSQGREVIPMDRFRPNIVLSGLDAFEEDYAGFIDLINADNSSDSESESDSDNAIQLKAVKPCTRCTIPAVDQLTGESGPDPVDILQTYRANPLLDGGITFGMNLIVSKGVGSQIHVGDQVDLQLAF